MSAESGPAEQVAGPLTKNVALPLGKCRALLCGTAGTLNITMNGVALTNVPIQQGYNPLRIESIQAGGTATDLWAIY